MAASDLLRTSPTADSLTAPRRSAPSDRRHGMASWLRTRLMTLLALLAASLLLGACSPRHLIVRSLADELASQGSAPEDDVLLARDAAPFYLKLSESVLRQTPDDLKLAAAVAGGFTQYSYAFVAFEADRIEARDSRAAHAMRERAARLYRRARDHAMCALELSRPGFAAALAQAPDPRDARDPGALRLKADQVEAAYWAAASWGGLISLSKDHPDTVADLPLAIRLAHAAWQADPARLDGALASLMGTFEVARPSGSVAQATRYFDQAIAASQGRVAGAFVAKAEGIAQPAGDRAAFEQLLRQALQAADARRDLGNEVMRQRAEWLLVQADDLF